MRPPADGPGPLPNQRLGLLFGRLRTEPLAVAAFVLAAVATNLSVLKTAHLLLWAALVVLVLGGRYALANLFARAEANAREEGAWKVAFLGSLLLLGAALGSVGVAAASTGDLARAGLTLFALAALAVGSVPLYAGMLAPVLCLVLPALLPAGVYLLGRGPTAATLLGALACATPAIVALAAWGTGTLTRRVLELESENAQMRSHLDVRREQIEKLTVSLKSNAEKRQKAEAELRRTAAEVGLLKGKAQALSETLSRVSPLCPVTGIPNRRTFEEHLQQEWRRAMRERRPLSLIMCEVDHFEAYHDTYGAQAADALLNRIAKLTAGLGRRAGDLSGRLEGARFAILLPGCDSRNAVRMAEGLRKRIEAQRIPHAGAKPYEHVTAHLGVATMIPTPHRRLAELFERIDTAMYEARFQGGNKVVPYRALAKLRLERWDPKADGPLTAESLLQKLLIWGYEATRSVHAAGTVLPDTTYETETVCAVLSGELKIIVEGQAMVLNQGDCLFIPPGMTYSAEVVGSRPLVRYEARKTA